MLNIDIKKNKKYFIFNINSSSVSGALVYFDQVTNKPVIEYSAISDFEISEKVTIDILKKNTKESLKDVLAKLENYIKISENIFDIEKALIFLAPPWNRKDFNILVDERVEPFLVDEKYLENLIGGGGNIENNEDLISAEILSIKANDYNILLSELLGKKVSKVEVALFDTYMKKEDEYFFEEIIKEYFSFIDIKFYSFLSVFLDQIRKVYNINDDFAFLDFTGEVMEFGIYTDNQLKTVFSLASGKNKIIRAILKSGLAGNFKDARYILTLYIRNELEEKVKLRVSEIVSHEVEYITDRIEEKVMENKINFTPLKLFVISQGEMNQLIKELIIFKETYFLGRSYLKSIAESEDDSYFDNFLAIEADFIYKND